MNMRWVLFAPLVVVLAVSGLFAYALLTGVDPKALPSAREGQTMPDFRLADVEDESRVITPADLNGQKYLLNFWATWCPSCKYEHPYLNSLSEEGVRIIGVNYKDQRGLALDWLEDYANPYEIDIFDPNGDLGFDLGVTGAPETFFVDSGGIIQHRHQGPIDASRWDDKLKAIYDAMD